MEGYKNDTTKEFEHSRYEENLDISRFPASPWVW